MGGSSVVEVITGIVCPLLGMLISNGQWLAPLAVMQKARETHRLDNINPYPFPMIVMNATGWVIYSCYTKDHFLFWAVLPGVLLGLYYTIIVLTILTKSSAAEQHSPTYLAVERLLLFSFFFWSLLAIISTTAFPTDKESQFFIGIGTVIITILYYSAPLSSVLIVIRNKDSATMYLPLILVNMTNATLWTTYGLFATQDIMLWLPNGLGILLALLQLTLKFLYRLPTPPSSPPSSSSKLLVEEDGQDKKTMADNEGGRNRTRKRSVSVGNLGEMGGTSAKSSVGGGNVEGGGGSVKAVLRTISKTFSSRSIDTKEVYEEGVSALHDIEEGRQDPSPLIEGEGGLDVHDKLPLDKTK